MSASDSTNSRWFYLLLVPLAWAGCSLLHFRYPGDEYAMYFISSVAGSWIVFLLQPEIHNPFLPVSVAVAGALVLALAGGLLAWLRVRKALWIGLFAVSSPVILFLMLRSFPNLERALAKNGSWWAYICSAAQLGMYVASVLSVAVAGVTRLCCRAEASIRTTRV